MNNTSIKIGQREIELYFSTRTLIKISDRCGGDMSSLQNWLSDGTTGDKLEKISNIITDLANGAVIKQNANISLGLEQGSMHPLYADGYFADVLNPAELLEYQSVIYEALGMGYSFETPDNVQVEEYDADLAEIEASKEKNAVGA